MQASHGTEQQKSNVQKSLLAHSIVFTWISCLFDDEALQDIVIHGICINIYMHIYICIHIVISGRMHESREFVRPHQTKDGGAPTASGTQIEHVVLWVKLWLCGRAQVLHELAIDAQTYKFRQC